ncbi:hypothetical protein 3Fb_00001 [Ralstonia phage Eline]|uniref:KilA-N domain-containing protein n=2 Tax=Cimandefvirus TaxID=2843366 RepID=A0A7G5B9N1_9CAUD|nr:transcriptional regulator [Ralstonia phage Eline]YP_010078444.1 transcriptional regulator [Ralstonia phage Gerry]QMV33004.1 hypothetical protein 3Fb_00001 [Ralstonia phage Eline]QMV33211.1 hypothetical protein 23F_00050 [Ralstonia phage Gerry]
MSTLVIEAVAVRRDDQGRYCLNDLHRAAGGEKRHQPSDFLRTQQASDLVAELTVPGIPGTPPVETLRGGISQGTFVVKELVYAYAMWISAAFHLKVIRTFDAVQHQSAPSRQLTSTEMLLQSVQALVDVERRQAEQAAAIERQGAELARIGTQVDALNAPLPHRPANTESIIYIRGRIFTQYGIPAHVVDFVMHHSSYAPSPMLVKNSREEAQGATYAVWWTKDVSAAFRRFVGECSRVTPAFVTHPSIDGRFRMSPGAES